MYIRPHVSDYGTHRSRDRSGPGSSDHRTALSRHRTAPDRHDLLSGLPSPAFEGHRSGQSVIPLRHAEP